MIILIKYNLHNRVFQLSWPLLPPVTTDNRRSTLLRKIFRSKIDEVNELFKILDNEELSALCRSHRTVNHSSCLRIAGSVTMIHNNISMWQKIIRTASIRY
jgi:hypothetical protein